MVATDGSVRLFYRGQRRRQLLMLRVLRTVLRGPARTAAEDAVLLFTLERTCDAVANGELRDLGLTMAPTVRVLRGIVRRHIAPAARIARRR
jgi:hypothetical protein